MFNSKIVIGPIELQVLDEVVQSFQVGWRMLEGGEGRGPAHTKSTQKAKG